MGWREHVYERSHGMRDRMFPHMGHACSERTVCSHKGVIKPAGGIIRLSVPYHAVEKYIERVLDPKKTIRTDNQIRWIIRQGFNDAISSLPDFIPVDFHHLVAFSDPNDDELFGMYHLPLWPDEKGEYDLVAKTVELVRNDL